MRVAVLSDIHSNIVALDAVLSDAGDEKTIYFTELGLQPGDAIGVNLRAGYELRDTFGADGITTTDEPAMTS